MTTSLLAAAAKGSPQREPTAAPDPEREPLDASAPEGFTGLMVRAYPEDLAAVLRPLRALTTGRFALPALTGILLRGDRSGLRASATDLETFQTRPVPGAVICSKGEALVPGDRFAAVLGALEPTEPVVIWTEKEVTCIGQGTRVARFRGLPVEDFPTPDPGGENLGGFPGHALGAALERLAPVASTDEARPVLCTVAVQITKGSRDVTVVATDSYRLAIVKLRIPKAAEASATLPIPAGTAVRIAQDLRDQGTVLLRAGEGHVTFKSEASEWTVRLVPGEFPGWERLMPGPEGRETIEVDAEEIRGAIRRAAVVASDRDPIRITANGSVLVTSRSVDLGEYEEALDSATFDGTEREVCFNPAYLAGGIAFARTDRVSLSLPVENPLGPTLIAGEGGATYLLMPVRIPGAVVSG